MHLSVEIAVNLSNTKKLHNNDDIVVPRLCILWQHCIFLFVLVTSCYKDDIVVITQDQGRAEVECNDNDII